MNIKNMTKEDFTKVKLYDDHDIDGAESIVLLPREDSVEGLENQYVLIDMVVVKEATPICRVSGAVLDMILIEGFKKRGRPWQIHCLAKSGLMELFCGSHVITFDDIGDVIEGRIYSKIKL